METDYTRSDNVPPVPPCPSCGRPMRFVRAIPRLAALPELRTYECKGCAVTYTEAADQIADRTDESMAWTEPGT